jgi:hypothetical protein
MMEKKISTKNVLSKKTKLNTRALRILANRE